MFLVPYFGVTGLFWKYIIMKRTVILALALGILHAWVLELPAQIKKGPFTEPARSVRSRSFDVKHTRLELSLDWDTQTVEGKVSHRLVPFQRTRRLKLDAANMQIRKVSVRRAGEDGPGRGLEFRHKGELLDITLDTEYSPEDELTVVIDYRFVNPQRGLHFVVPDENEPNQQRIAWTQSEPEYARHWFPCFDSPNERCTSELLATVPEDYFVLSNGVLKGKKSKRV